MKSIGSVETRGMVGAVAAADAMLKTSNVKLIDFNFVGSGVMSVVIEGEVAAVTAAVERGAEVAAQICEVRAKDVLARPAEGVGGLLNENKSADKR